MHVCDAVRELLVAPKKSLSYYRQQKGLTSKLKHLFYKPQYELTTILNFQCCNHINSLRSTNLTIS